MKKPPPKGKRSSAQDSVFAITSFVMVLFAIGYVIIQVVDLYQKFIVEEQMKKEAIRKNYEQSVQLNQKLLLADCTGKIEEDTRGLNLRDVQFYPNEESPKYRLGMTEGFAKGTCNINGQTYTFRCTRVFVTPEPDSPAVRYRIPNTMYEYTMNVVYDPPLIAIPSASPISNTVLLSATRE